MNIKLYCILRHRSDVSLEDQAVQCCEGGTDALLLNGDILTPRETIEQGLKIRDVARKHKVLFFIGGRPDIALAVDADGVHLGREDVGIDLAKQIIGPRKTVGFSASSLGQAVAASEEGAGYIMTGPMFSQDKAALGVDIIRLIKKRIKAPVIAFGAINTDNIAEIIKSGADGVAVSRAVCGAPSVIEAARKFKELITGLYAKENPSGVK